MKNTARKKQLSLSERYEKNKKKIDLTRGGNTDYIEIITQGLGNQRKAPDTRVLNLLTVLKSLAEFRIPFVIETHGHAGCRDDMSLWGEDPQALGVPGIALGFIAHTGVGVSGQVCPAGRGSVGSVLELGGGTSDSLRGSE